MTSLHGVFSRTEKRRAPLEGSGRHASLLCWRAEAAESVLTHTKDMAEQLAMSQETAVEVLRAAQRADSAAVSYLADRMAALKAARAEAKAALARLQEASARAQALVRSVHTSCEALAACALQQRKRSCMRFAATREEQHPGLVVSHACLPCRHTPVCFEHP